MRTFGTISARILANSIPEPNTGCWLWMRAVNNSGYAIMTKDGATSLAHRNSYESFKGPIPNGLHIDHKCRVRSCVNPDHLEAVTVQENNRRAPRSDVKKSECKRGHPMTPDNLYLYKNGAVRLCKECCKIRQSERVR